MISGVIFDHDGTLVDTEKQHYRIWRDLLQELGHHFPEEDYIRNHNGIPTIESAARLVRRFELAMTVEQFCHIKQKRVLDAQEIPPLMSGAWEILHYLHGLGVPLAVATGARFPEVDRNLRHHGLDRFFSAVCTASHVERNKPLPDVYLLAAEKLGLAPSECLAVEDTATGMRSAVAAGMPCIVIPSANLGTVDFTAAAQIMSDLPALQYWLNREFRNRVSEVAG